MHALMLTGRNIMRATIRTIIAACAFAAMHHAAAHPVTTYRGICDASAGIDLGTGHFIVADDEHNALMIYQYGTPAHVGMVDLSKYLAAPDGKKNKESDLEGAARIGDRIYWIASHGRDRHGNVEPARYRLFVTRIDRTEGVPGVVPVAAQPYANLLTALAADPRFDVLTRASKLAPEAPGGLNIEGLADSEDGALLIGFRNPLPNKQALVLKLRNPADVVERGAAPVFDDLVRFDLSGRGIRSLERIGHQYMIVAGPHDDGDGKSIASRFALYKWSGSPADAPKFWTDVEPSDFHAEAIFEMQGEHQLYLLSDDGGDRADRVDCGRKPFPSNAKTFRGMALDYP
jgi:hypothetical protein